MADGADLIVPRAGVGQPVRRHEDARLLRGRGRFGDDLSLPGQAVAWVLRSPHAHAEVAAIVTVAASAAPGVVAVLTAADYLAVAPDVVRMRTDADVDALDDAIPTQAANPGWLAELAEQHGVGDSIGRACAALGIA